MTLKFQRANKKNSTKDNLILSRASSYARKLYWNTLENNESIFMKKMVKQFGQLQLISFTMLENLKSILSWNSLLASSKLWIGSLSSKKKKYDLANYNRIQVCVTIKNNVNKLLYIQSPLFTAKEFGTMKQVAFNIFT